MRTIVLPLCSSVVMCSSVLAQPTFTPLGFLTDDGFGPSIAWGISADGHTVVGQSNSPQGWEAFRWPR